ncbi:hypothetical protein IMSAG049_00281 [Clostridiales bacterium]|nr:hypothetical protein IMSAG049_00281 [Clostridiales bacterium]
MRVSNREIKNRFKMKNDISRAKADEAVEVSKWAFYEYEARGFLSKAEFLYEQSKYIHKRWWVIQGILLIGIWSLLLYEQSSPYTERCLGIAAPLFVVLIIPELWKNRYSNSMEIECTSYYSLRQVYAARLSLFAFTDILLLSIFFAMVAQISKISVLELIIQFLIPFNVACCICFNTLYSKKAVSEILSIVMCMLLSCIWFFVVINERVYEIISVPMWVVLLAVSIFYMLYCIKNGQKKCEEIWEVEELWN